jgi:hypothetical protein
VVSGRDTALQITVTNSLRFTADFTPRSPARRPH